MEDETRTALWVIVIAVVFVLLVFGALFLFKVVELPLRNLRREAIQHSFEYNVETVRQLRDWSRDHDELEKKLEVAETKELKSHYHDQLSDLEEQMREQAMRIPFEEIPEDVIKLLDLEPLED